MKNVEEGLERMVKGFVSIQKSKGEAERVVREIQRKRREAQEGEPVPTR